MSSVYVHVPFCNSICAYCDFMRCGYQESLADDWLNRVIKDIQQLPVCDVESIYIGGGTPSSLHVDQLERLLMALLPFAMHVKEYTIEANADSLSNEKIALMKKYYINRISLGAQSFQPDILKTIERSADFAMIKDRIETLIAYGIDNISIDLMYGLPKQSIAQWEDDLKKAITLPISHISLYSLTIEKNSKFGRMKIQPCAEEVETDMFEIAISFLQEYGFEHYEISNFAKPQKESLHNQGYWHYDDFYGIGCGASGKINHQRFDNTKNIHTYITQGAQAEIINLTKEDEMFEMIMMNLRLTQGIQAELFYKRFHVSLYETYKDAILQQIQLGNLCKKDGYLRATYQGMMILHDVLLAFL